MQAELGARTSFRDGERILEALLPVSPANHESLRTRTRAVARRIEAADRQAATEVMAVRNEPDKAAVADEHRPVVMLDGAYVCAVPGHQIRNFETICGKVEREGHSTRRFALVRSVAVQSYALLCAALQDQGWREGDAITVTSDGDPALPALVRSATGGPVEYILDWFHLSMRNHHLEQVMGGLCVLEPPPLVSLDQAQIDVERLRHLLWNGHHERACEALGRIVSWAKEAIVLNEPAMETKARRLVARCTELRAYIKANKGALIDYGRRRQADLDLAGRGHRQPAGECPHEQAPANALVTSMRPSCASGQGGVAGRAIWPPSNPARGVAPQVFDTPPHHSGTQ